MEDNSTYTKELIDFKDEKQALVIQVIIFIAFTSCFAFVILFFGGWLIVNIIQTFHLSTLSSFYLLFFFILILIWGSAWVIKIDLVKIEYIKKLNAIIQAGTEKNYAEFNRQKPLMDSYYQKYFNKKTIFTVDPPIIGKLFKKRH